MARVLKSVIIAVIKAYQKALSPFMGGQCRFYPSCSYYTIRALEKNGILKGSAKAAWRILRCNPLSKGGIDYP